MEPTNYEVVKAKLFPRIGAFLLDGILCFFIFVAVYNFISYPTAVKYWSVDVLDQQYNQLAVQYGIMVEVIDEETQEITLQYAEGVTNEMYDAFYADEQVILIGSQLEQYNLYQIAFTFFVAQFVVFFLAPLFLKNGQTVGKKMMAIGLVSSNGNRVQNWQVFARFMVGTYSVETMLSFVLLFYGLPFLTIVITVVLGLVTKQRRALHDYIAGTIVVDWRATLVANQVNQTTLVENKG